MASVLLAHQPRFQALGFKHREINVSRIVAETPGFIRGEILNTEFSIPDFFSCLHFANFGCHWEK